MIRTLKRAYGGGFRAGQAPRRLVRPGGTRGIKVLAEPINPYTEWWQFFERLAYDLGVRDGTMKRLSIRRRVRGVFYGR